jgi:hypothetical protein
MRRSGYAAVRSTAVQALLELAAVNAPADARRPKKPISQIVAEARARGSVPASRAPKSVPESVEQDPADAT